MADSSDGEKREVAVLVTDAVGSLAMMDRLDPEDVHQLMDGFFALALEAVHNQRGTVNQFRGDGFMALFGSGSSGVSPALDAVRAALGVQAAVEEYSESVRSRFGVSFGVRSGLHMGRVWVGAVAGGLRDDYTAEGPTVGIANRLSVAASPGQILVSESIANFVAPAIPVTPLGARVLRGLSQSLMVFAVNRADGLTDAPLLAITDCSQEMLQWLREDPRRLKGLDPAQLELFILERLTTLGASALQVNRTNRPDGGVDIVARYATPVDCLVVFQAEAHPSQRRTGVAKARDLAGTVMSGPFNFGVLVSNTEFTSNAIDYIDKLSLFMRRAAFGELSQWLLDNFVLRPAPAQRLPDSITLPGGPTIRLPSGSIYDHRGRKVKPDA